MRLTKEKRKALVAGEAIEHTYPPSENPPLSPGRSYRVERSELRVLVARQKRTPEGWTAVLTPDAHERPRLLAKVGGYTDYYPEALPDEPEAVDKHTQNAFSKKAEKDFNDHRTDELVARAAAVGIDDVDELG